MKGAALYGTSSKLFNFVVTYGKNMILALFAMRLRKLCNEAKCEHESATACLQATRVAAMSVTTSPDVEDSILDCKIYTVEELLIESLPIR